MTTECDCKCSHTCLYWSIPGSMYEVNNLVTFMWQLMLEKGRAEKSGDWRAKDRIRKGTVHSKIKLWVNFNRQSKNEIEVTEKKPKCILAGLWTWSHNLLHFRHLLCVHECRHVGLISENVQNSVVGIQRQLNGCVLAVHVVIDTWGQGVIKFP